MSGAGETHPGQPRPSVARADVKTGFRCNNRCLFCVQGDKRARYPDRSTEEVKALLAAARREAKAVVFTGGEVTIRSDLCELVAFARGLGFTGIQVQTNGRMLAYPALCRDLLAAGATEFSPSLHGHAETVHDYLTGCAGSFRQTVKGIRNLKDLGARVLVNSVIVRSNFRHLRDLARLLVSLRVDQFQLAMVHPVGTAMARFASVVPRFALVEEHVHAGLEVALRAGTRVMTEAVPYCRMRGYESCVAERIIPATLILDAEQVIDDYTEYRWAEGKAHGPPCERCALRQLCEGPWREYPERFGWSEFQPVERVPRILERAVAAARSATRATTVRTRAVEDMVAPDRETPGGRRAPAATGEARG
ncbi:MAG: radical SAM protein [Planctomycetes bacterium]|nr:radical SAM protein [Planctomycetota bacterium]